VKFSLLTLLIAMGVIPPLIWIVATRGRVFSDELAMPYDKAIVTIGVLGWVAAFLVLRRHLNSSAADQEQD
jgi:hypothetical protein